VGTGPRGDKKRKQRTGWCKDENVEGGVKWFVVARKKLKILRQREKPENRAAIREEGGETKKGGKNLSGINGKNNWGRGHDIFAPRGPGREGPQAKKCRAKWVGGAQGEGQEQTNLWGRHRRPGKTSPAAKRKEKESGKVYAGRPARATKGRKVS